jgi:hypothetical protein
MKTGILITAALLLFLFSSGQNARVILVKHELRWTDETRFPNYFLDPELRDSIFSDTRKELMKTLQTADVAFPGKVEYKIINGFGNQKVEMPSEVSGSDPEIGIFSFITRGTSGFAIFWKLNILVRENGKMVLSKGVSHELEYYDASGYFSPRRWLSPEDFRAIFGRLVKEALGSLPPSDEKIIIGSPEEKEEMIRSLFPESERALLKIRGNWRDAGNFAALLEAGNDTLVRMNYKDGWERESVMPSRSAVFAHLFTAVTGIDMSYEQKVSREKKGTMQFPDGRKTKIWLRWIELQERSVKDGSSISRITDPLHTELYDGRTKTGDFLYTRREKIHSTDQTKMKFNLFTGAQVQNSLGIEHTRRIEGFLGDTAIFAEFNEYHGIIEVSRDTVLLAMMVAQNCNPENQSFGKEKLSKNKKIASYGTSIGKQSLDKTEKVEWYPVYLPAHASPETAEICLKILSCLFFGMGNPSQPDSSSE